MKWVVAVVVAAALAGVAFSFIRPRPPSPDARSGETRDGVQLTRLSAQVEALQRHLDSVESRLAARPPSAAAGPGVADGAPSEQSTDVDQQRAQEAEKHHEFMAGVAQMFAAERIDPAWANRASARVESAFGSDEALREVPRNIECREKICRVEIEDDGTDRLNRRMHFIATGLADVLPNISAEHVDRGNGRGATVLFLSGQPLFQAVPQGK